jgi:hypothetical protein
MTNRRISLEVHDGFGRTEYLTLLRNMNVKTGIEIGIYNAENSEIIMKRLDGIKFFGVDPYLNYPEYDDICNNPQVIQDKRYEMTDLLFKHYGHNLIRKTSEDASKDFEDNYFDFVYIDANHNTEYVKRDLNLWWPKVKNEGVLSGHDFSWHYIGTVVSAVMEFAQEKDRNISIFQSGAIWIIKK